MATGVIFSISVVLAFSHHFSSSAFLRSVFRQSSHLSDGLSRFLQLPFLSRGLFGNISFFILTCYYFANYANLGVELWSVREPMFRCQFPDRITSAKIACDFYMWSKFRGECFLGSDFLSSESLFEKDD